MTEQNGTDAQPICFGAFGIKPRKFALRSVTLLQNDTMQCDGRPHAQEDNVRLHIGRHALSHHMHPTHHMHKRVHGVLVFACAATTRTHVGGHHRSYNVQMLRLIQGTRHCARSVKAARWACSSAARDCCKTKTHRQTSSKAV
jgi:hypothetical protein